MAGLNPALQRALRVLTVGLAAACTPATPPFHGADLSGASYGQQWALIDSDQQPRSLANYQGQVLLIYFGFIHCPDICPVTLGHLRDTLQVLGPQADQVRVLFVTVDAEHDTPAALHEYLSGFGPRFTGLTGSAAALAAAAKDFKVYAEKKGEVNFEHAGFVYAMDRQGKPRILFGPDATPRDMAEDVRRLLSS